MQLSVSMVIYRIRLFMSLCKGIFFNEKNEKKGYSYNLIMLKTRLIIYNYNGNEELNLVVKSFKFDAMQLSVSMVIYRIRLFMSLCKGIFSRHA